MTTECFICCIRKKTDEKLIVHDIMLRWLEDYDLLWESFTVIAVIA
jgi:hypothetical protein